MQLLHLPPQVHFLTFAPRSALNVIRGEEDLVTYTFNTHTIRNRFCSTCGTASLGEGKQPTGGATAAINVRCLETVDFSEIKPIPFNGQDARS